MASLGRDLCLRLWRLGNCELRLLWTSGKHLALDWPARLLPGSPTRIAGFAAVIQSSSIAPFHPIVPV